MKAYRIMDVQVRQLLTWTPYICALTAFIPTKESPVPSGKKLGGPQNWSGHCCPESKHDSSVVQPVSYSPYRLSYTVFIEVPFNMCGAETRRWTDRQICTLPIVDHQNGKWGWSDMELAGIHETVRIWSRNCAASDWHWHSIEWFHHDDKNFAWSELRSFSFSCSLYHRIIKWIDVSCPLY